MGEYTQIVAAAILVLAIIGVGAITNVVADFIVGSFSHQRAQRKFEEAVKNTIEAERADLDHILILGEAKRLTTKEIRGGLVQVCAHYLEKDDKDDADYQTIERIRGHITELEQREPFDGVPPQIRIHMERLRQLLPDEPHTLQPLAEQLRDYSREAMAEKRTQTLLAWAGFAVGAVGLVYALWPSFKGWFSG